MNTTLATVAQVKQRNVYLVKTALRNMEQGTKQSIARRTGLSVTTCNSILNELHDTGEVILTGEATEKSIGRPAKSYALNRDFEYVCCLYPFVESGSSQSFFHYAVMDMLGNTVENGTAPCTEQAWTEIEALLKSLIIKHPKISTVSIGIAGYSDNDIWLSSCFFTSFNGQDVVRNLSESLGRETLVENDMNAIAYGIYRSGLCEKFHQDSMVVIGILESSGIGAGIIYHGNIMHGFQNFAGELGWISDFDGTVNQQLSQGYGSVIDCAVRSVETVTAILNPPICVLIGERFQTDAVARIQEKCQSRMPENVMPELVYLDHYNDFFINGLYYAALEHILGA